MEVFLLNVIFAAQKLTIMLNATLLGEIAGDPIGSVYEPNPTTNNNFRLLGESMTTTHDSIITIAVTEWILRGLNVSLQYSTPKSL